MAKPKNVRKRPNGDFDAIYRTPTGERVAQPCVNDAGERIREERAAIKFREAREAEVAAGTWVDWRTPEGKRAIAAGKPGGLFSDDWADWISRRGTVITQHDDITSGALHILPFFRDNHPRGAALRTAEITAADLRDFIAHLRGKISDTTGKPLSNNYVHNITTRLRSFLNDAAAYDKILFSPFTKLPTLDRTRASEQHEMPDLRFYAAWEIECLISHPEIPTRRRVLYALQFFTGTRNGETAGFRWYDYNREARTIEVARQYEGRKRKSMRGKTAPPNVIPVHSELAAILDEWHREGFASVYGRAPEPGDFIVPASRGTARAACQRTVQDGLRVDLERIGAEPSTQTHGFRRAFAEIAEENGADPNWIEAVIHMKGRAYRHKRATEGRIDAMRRAVECIPVRRRDPSTFALSAPQGRPRGPRGTFLPRAAAATLAALPLPDFDLADAAEE